MFNEMQPKKKILITASTFPRWVGDTEPRFILDYARTMTKYYEVHVLVPMAPNSLKEEIVDGVFVHRFHYFPIHKFETLCYPGAIVARIKEKKIRLLLVPFFMISLYLNLIKYSKTVDLVHAHWLIPQGIMQAFIRSKPYIVTGHGSDVTSLNFWPISGFKKLALKKASYITVVSSVLQEEIQKIIPNSKTSIISMGCDTSLFSPNNRIDDYFGIADKKSVLFVGRLVEIKGIEYLIEAMDQIENAVLYIVGKGPLEQNLKDKASIYDDKIVFLGAKTHEELINIYASADVLVAPSISMKDGGKEGLCLAIVEAMASGIPVVASNSGGISDVVKDRYNGLLCKEKSSEDIARKVNLVLNDKVLRDELVKNAKDTAYKFSYEEIGKKYHTIMSKLI